MKFIKIIEKNLNIKAKLNLCPMPMGDVIATKAETSSLYEWVNFYPSTTLEDGMQKFINWFKIIVKNYFIFDVMQYLI